MGAEPVAGREGGWLGGNAPTGAAAPRPAGERLSVRASLRRGPFHLDVELEVAPGITVLFGPSGSGKSTLLDVVAGLVRPDAGRVSLGQRVLLDTDAGTDLPARSRRVGYVLQSLALFPHYTALQNVAFGLAGLPRPEREARAGALLEALGVGALGPRRPGSLSGGERQRVAIARALAPDPSVLLLDEPLAALDRPRRRDLVSLLRRLVSARSLPTLYVTHDQEEAEALGDRVVVLDSGRVAAQGEPLSVLDAPSRWSVASLARTSENLLAGTVLERRDQDGALAVRVGDAAGDPAGDPPTAGGVTLLTRPSEFGPGAPVTVAIRAAEVVLSLDPPGRISAANVLAGRVAAVHADAGRAVVLVELRCDPGGFVLGSEVTPSARQRLGLEPGTRVWAICKTLSCHALPRT